MTSGSFRWGLLAGLAAATGATATMLWFMRQRFRSEPAEPGLDDLTLDDPIDETAAESFPASDPPAHAATLGAKTPA